MAISVFFICRISHDTVKFWVSGHTCKYSGGRLLPIYLLLPPTVCHGMAHYVVSSGVSAVTFKMMNRRQDSQDKAAVTQVRNEQFSNALGHFLADALLYPVETVLHRLHLQGNLFTSGLLFGRCTFGAQNPLWKSSQGPLLFQHRT